MKYTVQTNKTHYKNKGKTLLDVMFILEPKQPNISKKKQPLNIALAIDCSSSMSELAERKNFSDNNSYDVRFILSQNSAKTKMEYAKKASIQAILSLNDEDRVSIIAFDDCAYIISESILVKNNKNHLIEKIQSIQPKGSTDLHNGWVQAGKQVAHYLDSNLLNRILILTDGQTNKGKTLVDDICNDISVLKNKKISTSTIGVGLDYNEILLENMAKSGDGNYYYVEQISELEKLFLNEFQDMNLLMGENVQFKFLPQPYYKIVDCYNDFHQHQESYQLPNLIHNKKSYLLYQIEIQSKKIPSNFELKALLTWDFQGKSFEKELSISLSSIDISSLKKESENSEVVAQKAVYIAAREKDKALESLRNGDIIGSTQFFQSAHQVLSSAPVTQSTAMALNASQKEIDLSKNQDYENLKKLASYQNYQSRNSKN